jgi:23S rRNA pseudouridine1911/1915/1917 synthase
MSAGNRRGPLICWARTAVNELFKTIYEDAELLVVNKPAGLVCHPTKTDEYSSLISRLRLYLGQGSHPQLVNRLDRETSGVTLAAKTEEAARALRRLWENRQVEKEYAAIVHGHPAQAHGVIDAPLGKDEQSRVAIKDCVRADGAPARTEYWVERRFSGPCQTSLSHQVSTINSPFSLLRVLPHTGRKHQIRIHLAHLGHPVVGDKLYGGDEDLYLALVEGRLTAEQWRRLLLPHHALHAREVRFTWHGRPAVFRAEPEGWFTEFARAW